MISLLFKFTNSPRRCFCIEAKRAVPFSTEICCCRIWLLEKAKGLTMQGFKPDPVVLAIVYHPPSFNGVFLILGLDMGIINRKINPNSIPGRSTVHSGADIRYEDSFFAVVYHDMK